MSWRALFCPGQWFGHPWLIYLKDLENENWQMSHRPHLISFQKFHGDLKYLYYTHFYQREKTVT